MRLKVFAMGLALAGAACSPDLSNEEQAKRLAIDVVRKEVPDNYAVTHNTPAIAIDRGDYWLITFEHPASTGGPPQVDVRKSDLKVMAVRAYQ